MDYPPYMLINHKNTIEQLLLDIVTNRLFLETLKSYYMTPNQFEGIMKNEIQNCPKLTG